jgi:signal transduction histidine kinase
MKQLNKDKNKNQDLILKVRELLGQSVQETREIAHRLLPKILEDHSLLHALNDLFEENERIIKISFNHNLDREDVFEKNVEHALYRIIQEALTNVLKYAGASRFEVQLMAYNDQVIVTLSDDGIGFEVQQLDFSKTGFGLRSMKSRADSVGGFCQIDSSKGQGTHILINIPISIEA